MLYSSTVLLLAITLISCTIAFLVTSASQRKRILQRISVYFPAFACGQSSASTTPPRSLSPEKKEPNDATSYSSYKDVLPPSSRDGLRDILKSLPESKEVALSQTPKNEAEFMKNIIPFTADWRECGPSTYTPMGISVEEIRTLGDFPDYSTLSGVPIPEPYRKFNIHKAIPRPYRPFRWAYHQTMCKTYLLILLAIEANKDRRHSPYANGDRLVARAGEHVH